VYTKVISDNYSKGTLVCISDVGNILFLNSAMSRRISGKKGSNKMVSYY